eukprot:CAMPEP_0182425590 /NCGR_PEP_ID=MMETSP1167-20130531/12051_1 /TAXON_ID=2988 /ORGANISM="Mallomonas Sp, Strain CCMP3275" /LENGTH=282 /DNA_ID=CAMNT_0024606449 /DNA_START=122 /DNA_END=970 /DNA_ORIENTATION=-
MNLINIFIWLAFEIGHHIVKGFDSGVAYHIALYGLVGNFEPSIHRFKSCSTFGNPPKIIIAGPPASGKGTQCEAIKNEFGVVHLSTGDILRAAVKANTDLGRVAQSHMDAGQLVPDELVIDVIKERLNQEDCRLRGWLLDGFPRTERQASALIDAGLLPDVFILLDVADNLLVDRVTGRRIDPISGKIYHKIYNPPLDRVVAERLVQRSDDTEAKIKVRIQEYKSHIDSVISFFGNKILTIDGSKTASEVTHQVLYAIGQRLQHEEVTSTNKRNRMQQRISV